MTKEMVAFPAMKSYLEENNFHYFKTYPQIPKSIKAVINHLAPVTQTEAISNGLGD
jgi:hypothetical protein